MSNLMRFATATAVLGLTGACAMAPQGVGPETAALYDAAVASVGCEMRTEREYLAVELQTGMTREQTIQMGQFRMAAGAAEPTEGGGVRLTTGACA
ncbi:hypothetical protein [Pseudooceanicola sp.]|uniref:hypothetical protein n=1 Tax=Pseudooceanicola sp. TaxID=1914328 RepID=UPI0026197D55|nr:hypothetical protein [Pseudooceanicola sp.]MDF1855515.1 hypothetical protein [Pseudooceanicola sp.]